MRNGKLMEARSSVTDKENAAGAPNPVRFEATDGFPLNGELFVGDGDGPLVLISCATGAPRTFYNKYAAWIVENGAKAALTYDYRGMPGSPAPNSWTGRINLKDWALCDFPAAAMRLREHDPDSTVVGIGQSFGGQALGLCGVADMFERYVFIATLSGYWGNLSQPLKSYVLMNLVGIPATWILGRTTQWMGLGQGIPGTVYRDWARWCRMPNYFFDDKELKETSRFADVRTPILSIGFTDDIWGTPAAIGDFVRHYEAADLTQIWISPEDTAGKPIGHLGYFRSHHKETLWPLSSDWLLKGRMPKER